MQCTLIEIKRDITEFCRLIHGLEVEVRIELAPCLDSVLRGAAADGYELM